MIINLQREHFINKIVKVMYLTMNIYTNGSVFIDYIVLLSTYLKYAHNLEEDKNSHETLFVRV